MDPGEYVASPQTVQEEVLRKERVRFSTEPMSSDWIQTVSPGHLGKLEDALAVYGSISGTIVDLDHNVCMKGRSSAKQVPPLLTHCTYQHTVLQRPMVGLEHLLAQGISTG